ncbi:MAG: hypothetical protein QXH71_04155 [Candidatus Anstonellaceae archaeon]
MSLIKKPQSSINKTSINKTKNNKFSYRIKSFFTKFLILSSLLYSAPLSSQLKNSTQSFPTFAAKKAQALPQDKSGPAFTNNSAVDSTTVDISIKKNIYPDTLQIQLDSNNYLVIHTAAKPLPEVFSQSLAYISSPHPHAIINYNNLNSLAQQGFSFSLNSQNISVVVPDSLQEPLTYTLIGYSAPNAISGGVQIPLSSNSSNSSKWVFDFKGGFYTLSTYSLSHDPKQNILSLSNDSQQKLLVGGGISYSNSIFCGNFGITHFQDFGYSLNIAGTVSVPFTNTSNLLLASHYSSTFNRNLNYASSYLNFSGGFTLWGLYFIGGYNNYQNYFYPTNYSNLNFSVGGILINQLSRVLTAGFSAHVDKSSVNYYQFSINFENNFLKLSGQINIPNSNQNSNPNSLKLHVLPNILIVGSFKL